MVAFEILPVELYFFFGYKVLIPLFITMTLKNKRSIFIHFPLIIKGNSSYTLSIGDRPVEGKGGRCGGKQAFEFLLATGDNVITGVIVVAFPDALPDFSVTSEVSTSQSSCPMCDGDLGEDARPSELT